MRDFTEFLKENDPEMAEAAIEYLNWHKKDRASKAGRGKGPVHQVKKKECGCHASQVCDKCRGENKRKK